MRLPTPGSTTAKRLAQGNRRVPFSALLLRTLYGVGIISSALIAPKMLSLFKILDQKKHARKRLYARVAQSLSRLRSAGYIEIEIVDGIRHIRLTDKGEEEIEKILLHTYQIPEPAFWDGKWRIAIFDIREKRKRTRDLLRKLLDGVGFIRLQDSVWVYPYACEEFLELIRAHLKSGHNELIVFMADGLTSDRALREHFELD